MFGTLGHVDIIHPMFVHFPIAFILAGLAMESLFMVRRTDSYGRCSEWLVYLGLVSSVAAVLSGLRDTDRQGHDTPDHELVHLHRDIMIWMTIAALLAAGIVLVSKWRNSSALRRWLILPLAIAALLLVYGADKGAELVFRHGHGVQGWMTGDNPEQEEVRIGPSEQGQGSEVKDSDSSHSGHRH